jgi:hypothetical protein
MLLSKDFTFTAMLEPPLWSSGQSSWLQIQRSRVQFMTLPDFPRSSGSGTGALSLVSAIEDLLRRNSSSSSLEIREYGCGDPLCWQCNTHYLQKVGTNFADKQ